MAVTWCDRCGDEMQGQEHAQCQEARRLEPPRYCPECRRRLKVQVLPAGWHATCAEHGNLKQAACS
jgi:hypothetical protein